MKVEQRAPAGGQFDQRFARIEGLLAQLLASPDPLAERVTREILATVLELHQHGLTRLFELSGTSESMREALARDACVSAMLLLHGLHPLSLDTRVRRALESLSERHQSKTEDVSSTIEGARVAVRIVFAASACGSTRGALKKDYEDTLVAAVPDAESILVECAEPAPTLVTLRLRREALAQGEQARSR